MYVELQQVENEDKEEEEDEKEVCQCAVEALCNESTDSPLWAALGRVPDADAMRDPTQYVAWRGCHTLDKDKVEVVIRFSVNKSAPKGPGTLISGAEFYALAAEDRKRLAAGYLETVKTIQEWVVRNKAPLPVFVTVPVALRDVRDMYVDRLGFAYGWDGKARPDPLTGTESYLFKWS